ncbi:MAG: hypothetical protein Tsb009_37310 [Planctomycetaceae bacterium]
MNDDVPSTILKKDLPSNVRLRTNCDQTASNGMRHRWFANWANVGLIAFLTAECIYGVLFASEGMLDILLWVGIAAVLVVNTARRSPPFAADTRWWVWLVCVLSTIRFLAFEYGEETRWAYWTLIVLNLFADMALLSLGRSFSLMPARREIRSGGLYRLVRHPAYTGYMIVDLIYVSMLPTLRNIAVLMIGMGLFACRAYLEERLLAQDPHYREYMTRTRWRFLPLIY